MGYKRKLSKLHDKLYGKIRAEMAASKRIKYYKKETDYSLKREQIDEIRDYWRPYVQPDLVSYKYLTEKTDGIFFANYIPMDVYVKYIDPYFNDMDATRYLDNKCFFPNMFNGINQPRTLLKRENNIWYVGNVPSTDADLIMNALNGHKGVFVKEALESSGGYGVEYIENTDDIVNVLFETTKKFSTDVIVQEEVFQHEDLAKLNDSSVNTIRIFSFLDRDGCTKVYSSVLRMGIDGSKVDNYSSGGVSCGITSEGKLRANGYNKSGERLTQHPTSGIVFEGYTVPSYSKAVELVKKAHPMIPHFRMVSWDVAIDKNGVPVLIEANLCRGGIDLLQLNNGPLFGDDTEKILDEVFKNNVD